MVTRLRGWLRRVFSPERTLLVMRLEDMLVVHPKMSSSYFCSVCHARVGIYPSGQLVLQRYQRVRIVCQRCASSDEVKDAEPAPGSLAERGHGVWRGEKEI